jgi:hypothetical protein
LTSVRGAATSLALLAAGNEVIAAWADARDAEQPGWADIFAARLRASDASPIAAEQRVVQTRAHSHSPVLARRGAQSVLAWIEDPVTGEKRRASVNIVDLDEQARVSSATLAVTAADGSPLSVALSCWAEKCRAVMPVDLGDTAELQSFEVTGRAHASKVIRLAQLAEAAGQAVAPVLIGSELFYSDLAAHQHGRVRHMRLEWE